MKIQIIYDNTAQNDFKGGWGFSCYIEVNEKKILFDTGWNGNILLYNMKLMDVNPEELDKIILSHSHWDHIGGLNHLLKYETFPDVYLPQSFSPNLKDEIKRFANIIEISKQRKINKNIWTTGELGEATKEQSLFIKTENGNVMITGCAHPGLDNIIKSLKNLGNIRVIIGGFHDSKINGLEAFQMVIPCHCTQKKDEIIKQNPKSFRECKVGSTFKF